MQPNRSIDGSVASTSSSVSHAGQLGSSRISSNSNFANSAQSGSNALWTTRLTNTFRTQIHKVERDGLTKTLLGSQRVLGSSSERRGSLASNSAGVGGVSAGNIWDALKRTIPALLVVDNEAADAGSSWQYTDKQDSKSPASDEGDFVLDEKEISNHATSRRKSRSHGARLLKLSQYLDAMRRKLGIGRASFLLLLFLLSWGLYEVIFNTSPVPSEPRSVSTMPHHLHISTKDPFKTLAQAGIRLPATASAWTRSEVEGGIDAGDTAVDSASSRRASLLRKQGTTAIVLNWKRTQNLVVILAHLCAYAGPVFEAVHVWNNNPDIFLTEEVREKD